MKKMKRIGYIVLIVILLVMTLTIYTNASKVDGNSQKEKGFSEIKFVETKLLNLFNTMNNIDTRNYKVTTSELSKETIEATEKPSTSGGESEQGGSSSGGSGASGGNSSESQDKTSKSQDEEDNKKFELEANGVLTNTEEINWGSVKSEIENLYMSLPTITMDLYQLNVNQEDVLGFNTEFDKLTTMAKDENKEETLTQLTKLYEYLPKFLRSTGQDELYITLVETKSNILKGYAKLDAQNWQEISTDVKTAIDSYARLLTSTEIDATKQYNVSKTYIMLNELQKAVTLQDTSVFLIKYKNLIEEINNIVSVKLM